MRFKQKINTICGQIMDNNDEHFDEEEPTLSLQELISAQEEMEQVFRGS